MIASIKKAFSSLYQEFVSTHDSPQRIALGFGLGFFLGILPFTGTAAAIVVAWFLKLNKPAAILGSLLSNTWLSFVIFGIAVNFSCSFLGLNSSEVQLKFQNLIKNFHWADLKDPFLLKTMAVIALGYLIVSILLSLLAYGACLVFIYWKRQSR